MDRIRMSLRVCQIRLRKTFTTPRFYVALLWIAILFHVMTAGIRGFCEQTGVDVTFWMLPFMTSYHKKILKIPDTSPMELVPSHLARQLQRFCYKLSYIIKKSRCADQHKQIFYFPRYHKR